MKQLASIQLANDYGIRIEEALELVLEDPCDEDSKVLMRPGWVRLVFKEEGVSEASVVIPFEKRQIVAEAIRGE